MGKKKEMPWIKLWRKSENDELYFSDPFDKWHAWQDLLLLADERGTLKTSVRRLKTRWNWNSTKTVWKHLGSLEETGKIAMKKTPSGTSITIVKWGVYQTDFSKKETPKSGKRETQKETQEDINKRSSKEPSQGSAPTTKEKNYSELNEELGDDW